MTDHVYRPNVYSSTVDEFCEYSIVERTFDDEHRCIGLFGIYHVGEPSERSLLCEMIISDTYPPVRLVKDCLRLCNRFDKMGYRLYAMSVPELSKFFETIGFKSYGVMDDGYIRWIYNGKKV